MATQRKTLKAVQVDRNGKAVKTAKTSTTGRAVVEKVTAVKRAVAKTAPLKLVTPVVKRVKKITPAAKLDQVLTSMAQDTPRNPKSTTVYRRDKRSAIQGMIDGASGLVNLMGMGQSGHEEQVIKIDILYADGSSFEVKGVTAWDVFLHPTGGLDVGYTFIHDYNDDLKSTRSTTQVITKTHDVVGIVQHLGEHLIMRHENLRGMAAKYLKNQSISPAPSLTESVSDVARRVLSAKV